MGKSGPEGNEMVIDRYASPRSLALVSSSPEAVCRLIFTVTGGDEDEIRTIRGLRGRASDWERRAAISLVAREYLGATFTQIGRALNRDHSVIVRGYERAKVLRRRSPAFWLLCEPLIASIPRGTKARVAKRVQHLSRA